jgi:aminoglycoside phosphotransferase
MTLVGAPGSDALLQASRRIDWRFLLATPELGSVACVSATGAPDLIADLRQHVEHVVVVEDNRIDEAAGSGCDCVVLRNPAPDDIARAASLVDRGGHVYVELERKGLARRLDPARCRGALLKAGFSAPRLYWHWPSFSACAEIVPLSDPGPLRLALSRRRSSRAARAGAALARVLPRRALELAAPSVSIVARRQIDSASPAVIEHLEQNRERLDLAGHGLGGAISGLLVTPRFRASRHVVVLVTPRASPEPRLVVKVPRLRADTSGIEREAANVDEIQAARPGGYEGIPRVVALDEIGGRRALIETALASAPMTPALVRRHPDRCVEAGLGLISELPRAPAEPAWFERLLERPLGRFAARFRDSEDAELVERTLALLAPLRSASLDLAFEHGDLSAPNILISRSWHAGLVDWELAEPRGLPFADLCFFLTYVSLARARARELPAQVRAFERAFLTRDAWTSDVVRRHAAERATPLALVPLLLVACFARYAARLLDRLDGDLPGFDADARDPVAPAEAGTVAWLHDNRYYQFWRRALEAASGPGESATGL